MRLCERLRGMIKGYPPGSLVSLPIEVIEGWLADEGISFEPDLTVSEVAERFSRSPCTVRAWIRAGLLRAYKFRGREYRIPSSALEEFQRREALRRN